MDDKRAVSKERGEAVSENACCHISLIHGINHDGTLLTCLK